MMKFLIISLSIVGLVVVYALLEADRYNRNIDRYDDDEKNSNKLNES